MFNEKKQTRDKSKRTVGYVHPSNKIQDPDTKNSFMQSSCKEFSPTQTS